MRYRRWQRLSTGAVWDDLSRAERASRLDGAQREGLTRHVAGYVVGSHEAAPAMLLSALANALQCCVTAV